MEVGEEEVVTWAEKQENYDFLNAIMSTNVMKEAHRFLVFKNAAPTDKGKFKEMLHDIWFKLFRRAGGRYLKCSCLSV